MYDLLKLKLFCACLVILFVSCDQDVAYEENIAIPDGKWNRHNIAEFRTEIGDTLQPYNVYINVRNTGKYPKSNLYLFVTTTAPGGAYMRDTVECILADPSGQWRGKGFGSVWQNRFPYRKHVRFAEEGIYKIEVEQAMRLEDLPGIKDVGIRIEKVTD